MKRWLSYKLILVLNSILIFALQNCSPPEVQTFNHSRTLFPLKAAHFGVDCRECHKDGSITSLPTACLSCHPMPFQHTKNLGDCDLCHTQATFSAAFYNHARSGLQITGAHKVLVADDCFYCHNRTTYRGLSFICHECHQPPFLDTWVHTSSTANCQACHGQSSWFPAQFRKHNFFGLSLSGGHTGLRCNRCHTAPYSNWLSVNYKTLTFGDGSCADCHKTDYRSDKHHTNLSVDRDCGRCHGYSGFDD